MTNIIDIPLGKIEPDPNQPRKFFDEAKLQELAVSIREHKVQQPIKVRPHPTKDDGHFMLIFGERRWRASEIAGESTIPAVVEDLDETQVLERQLIENSQRENIHPLEEGEAYAKLVKHHRHSIETLISKTGRSRSHIYSRMKLTELAPGVKKALLAGELPAGHGELIGRIADPKLQEQCCREVLNRGDDSDHELEDLGIMPEALAIDERKPHGAVDLQPLSFRATQALIRRRYATKLALAKFEPEDATLTPAGSCGPCPHRSGNQPELPGLPSAKGDDLCTKPSCFTAKTAAAWTRSAAAAKERGLQVIEAKDAGDVFGFDGVSVSTSPRSPYVALDQELPYDLARTPGKPQTFAKLLGKRAADVPRVIVQDAAGAPRELLDRAKAVEILRELGKVDKTGSSPDAQHKKERAKDKAARALKEGALGVALYQIRHATFKIADNKELPWWRWIAAAVINLMECDPALDKVGDKRGFDGHYGALSFVNKAKDVGELRSLLIEVLVASNGDEMVSASGDIVVKESFETACKLAGIDWLKVQKEEKERIAKFVDPKKGAPKAEAAKKPAKKKGSK